jgi:hypothetical protein
MSNKSNNATASKKENPSHEDGLSSGAHGSKDNSECSSLRLNATPKSEKVTVVDAEKNAGATVAAAQRQNCSDGKSWTHGRNVIPASGDNSVLMNDSGE